MSHDPERRTDRARWSRSDSVAVAVVTALACAVRGFRLTQPPFIYSDELFYAREACNYVYRSPATCGIPLDAVSAHPPMGKWLISLGIRVSGWEPFGWRIASLIAGTLTVALLYVLARRIMRSTHGATLATGLLAIDFLHVVQSRIAMLDVFLTLFVVAAFAFTVVDRDHVAARGPRDAARTAVRSRGWLMAAGAAAGAAVATKWVGLVGLLGIATLSTIWAAQRAPGAAGSLTRFAAALRREWLPAAIAFTIVPAAVYVAVYMPRVEGSLLTVPWTPGSWARGFAREQLDMIEFHRSSAEIQFLGTTNPFVSPAWSWPLIKRPMIYYSEPRTVAGVETIMAIGSPLVWWTALASFAVIGLRLTRRRTSDDVSLVAVVGFGFMYLPLLVVSGLRPATFLYYLLPSVPFMCLAAAAVVSDGRIVRSRYATAAFSLAAIALLAFFYPVLTGVPLPERGLAMRQWFHDCHAATAISPPTGWCWR